MASLKFKEWLLQKWQEEQNPGPNSIELSPEVAKKMGQEASHLMNRGTAKDAGNALNMAIQKNLKQGDVSAAAAAVSNTNRNDMNQQKMMKKKMKKK